MGDQMIQFALATGLDSRKDQHSQELGSLAMAVNCVFDKLGAVRKRHGNVAQPTTVLPGNAYATGFGAGVQTGTLPVNPTGILARGGEQVLVGGNRVFSLSPSAADHVSKDQIQEAVGTRRPIHGAQAAPFGKLGTSTAASIGYYNADVCQTSAGFRIYAWTNYLAGGDVYFSVHDTTLPTITQVFAPVMAVNASLGIHTMARVMLVAVGAAAVLLFANTATGSIYGVTIAMSGSGWGSGPAKLLSVNSTSYSGGAPPPFDSVSDDGVHFILAGAAKPGASLGLFVSRFLPDLSFTGTYTEIYSSSYSTEATITAVACCVSTVSGGGGSPNLVVVWSTVATLPNNWRFALLVAATGATITSATTTTGSGQSLDGTYLSIYPISTTLSSVITNGQNGIGVTEMGSLNGVISSLSLTLGSPTCQPISRPFVYGAKTYLLAWIPSTLQGSYAWVDTNAESATTNTGTAGPRCVALLAPRLAPGSSVINGPRLYGSLGSIVTASTGLYVSPIGVVQGGSLPGSPNTMGLWEAQLNFQHPNIGSGQSLGRQLVTAQGIFDGTLCSEFGFTTYPEGYTGSGGSGGSLTPSSVYQYAIIWEWQTDAGELVQSTTQAARNGQVLTITLTAGENAVQLILEFVALSAVQPLMTTKFDVENGYSTPPVLAIYRTQAGGTSFTRVAGIAPTAGTALYPTSYTDTASDASIASNAPLYFEPGVQGSALDNVCPPSFSHTIVALQRIWGIGDDLRTIWFSQVYTEGFQPGFNEVLTMQLEDGDDLVALGVLNANVIIFTNRRIYMTYGTGPDATGGGTPFPSPQLVQSDVGCIDCRSVVGIPDGLIFRSAQGFCILDQSFNAHYLDGPEDIVTAYPNVRGATLVPEHHEVRFALDNGTNGIVLVLNYWNPQNAFAYNYSWFQLYDATSNTVQCIVTACGYVSGFRWGAVTGNLYTEDTTGATYMDGGSALANWVTMTVQTGWIEANGIVGYQRGRRVGLLGDWYTSHDLTLSAATDFVPTTASSSVTGQNHTFSSDFAQGGPLDRFIIYIKNQKHQALQITVSDAYPTGARAVVGSGQGFSLSGLALQADVKRGLGKLTAANRGAS